jgi:hypothetical protein
MKLENNLWKVGELCSLWSQRADLKKPFEHLIISTHTFLSHQGAVMTERKD